MPSVFVVSEVLTTYGSLSFRAKSRISNSSERRRCSTSRDMTNGTLASIRCLLGPIDLFKQHPSLDAGALRAKQSAAAGSDSVIAGIQGANLMVAERGIPFVMSREVEHLPPFTRIRIPRFRSDDREPYVVKTSETTNTERHLQDNQWPSAVDSFHDAAGQGSRPCRPCRNVLGGNG